MLRKIIGRGAMVLISLLIGIVLIEAALRAARPALPPVLQLIMRDVKKHPFTEQTILPPPAWQPVDAFQMTVVPGLDNELQYPNANVGFHVTSKNWLNPESNIGFRVDSADWEPQWPVDIVAVGDSFTFCFTEYADCWVNRLQTDYGYSVVNLGQGATGGVSHANILFTFGLPYKPKVVLWQWYGNDNNEDYGLVYQWGETDTTDRSAIDQKGWLVQHSILFTLVDVFTNTSDYGSESYLSQADTHSIEIAGERMMLGRAYSAETADLSLEKNVLGQAEGFNAILEARDRLAAEGIELIVFPVPYKEEVYQTKIELETDFDAQHIDKMIENRTALLDFCAEHQIVCVDPTPELVNRALDGDMLYLADDTHLNPLGNQVLLEFLLPWLEPFDLGTD